MSDLGRNEPPRIAQVLGQSAPPRELKLGNVALDEDRRKRWIRDEERLNLAQDCGWVYHSEKVHRGDDGSYDYSYTCGASYCRCMQ